MSNLRLHKAGNRRDVRLALIILGLCSAFWSGPAFAADPVPQGLTLATARSVLTAAESKAAERHLAVAIVVVDAGGFAVVSERADHVPAGMGEAALAKARTAALYGVATKGLSDLISKGATGLMALPQALPLEGGIPLFRDGQLVGAVGVAGSDSPSDGATAGAGAAVFASLL